MTEEAITECERKVSILRSTLSRRFREDEVIEKLIDDLECELSMTRSLFKKSTTQGVV